MIDTSLSGQLNFTTTAPLVLSPCRFTVTLNPHSAAWRAWNLTHVQVGRVWANVFSNVRYCKYNAAFTGLCSIAAIVFDELAEIHDPCRQQQYNHREEHQDTGSR